MKNIFSKKILLRFACEVASKLSVKNKTHKVCFFVTQQFDSECFELTLHVTFQELPSKLPLLIWTRLLPDSVNQ